MKYYYTVNLKLLDTNHFFTNVKINNVSGKFLIDSGASNSCVDLKKAKLFKLSLESCKEKAISASNEITKTHISYNNDIKIGEWFVKNYDIILFDMASINVAMLKTQNFEIDGIIGADILLESKATLDFEKKILQLKL